MKIYLLTLLLAPTLLFAQKINDSLTIIEHHQKIEILSNEVQDFKQKFDYQVRINEQTLNSISNQIGATSFNLSIFAFLFGVLAIGLGIYVTWVERKVLKIKVENESLLKQTITTKNEVVSINESIQKDIYGLFVKIKREETTNILNRLCKVPGDIPNVINELFSRELLKEDFLTLKKAYLCLIKEADLNKERLELHTSYYFLLFFQHFLDLTIKDKILEPEMVKRYKGAINGANSSDIIKSTEDFTKGIIDFGFQSMENHINEFLKCISTSHFNNFEKIYEIIYNGLRDRDDKFKFFELISDLKPLRKSKLSFGYLLINDFEKEELTNSEKIAIDKTKKVKIALELEEKKEKEAEIARKKKDEIELEKKKEAEIARKKKEEEKK